MKTLNNLNEMLSMQLNEIGQDMDGNKIKRVVGGWIYRLLTSNDFYYIFVPFPVKMNRDQEKLCFEFKPMYTDE